MQQIKKFHLPWNQFCKNFEFQDQTGFLVPYQYIPKQFQFAELEKILQTMYVMAQQQNTLYKNMSSIKQIDVASITNFRDLFILRDCLSNIIGQYLASQKMKKKEGEKISLPETFARTLIESSKKLDIKYGPTPGFCYNWRIKQFSTNNSELVNLVQNLFMNPQAKSQKSQNQKVIINDNSMIPFNFDLQNVDLKWFYTENHEQERIFFGTSIVSSYHLSRVIKFSYQINQIIQSQPQQTTQIRDLFDKIKFHWKIINRQLILLTQKLDKDFFNKVIRQYIGPMNNIFLEGINQYISSSGSSAGEDPSFQIFQKIFEIKYEAGFKKVQQKLKEGMCQKHRNLQKYFQQNTKIRQYCTQNQQMIVQFNQIIDCYVQFNKNHSYFLEKYILSFTPKHLRDKAMGTGQNRIKDLIDRWTIIANQKIPLQKAQ